MTTDQRRLALPVHDAPRARHLFMGAVSGAHLNPGVSLAFGPLVGVAVAVGCAWILRGRGGNPISHAAGSGVLTPGRGEAATTLAHEIDPETAKADQ